MPAGFRIAEWVVEPDLNSIRTSLRTVRLEPKVMQVLVCLAEHPGEVVCKEDLLRTVWQGTFVSEDVLTRAISTLRRIFDDCFKKPVVIQTIPKHGYRLIAEVAAYETFPLRSGSALSRGLAIAVAPFRVLSDKLLQMHCADAMRETLVARLAQLLLVPVLRCDGPLPANGENFQAILEASMFDDGKKVRLNVQLMSTTTQQPLWAEIYDHESGSVLEWQDRTAHDIARRIASLIR